MVTKISENSFDLLGKRWTALIVKDLINGPRRFRELLNDIGRINDKVLSQRLKELEDQGIIERRVFAEVPVRVEYRLTNRGRGLAGVIHAMQEWDATKMSHAAGKSQAMAESPAAETTVIETPAPVAEIKAEVKAEVKNEPVAYTPAPAPAAVPAQMEEKHKPFWKRLGL